MDGMLSGLTCLSCARAPLRLDAFALGSNNRLSRVDLFRAAMYAASSRNLLMNGSSKSRAALDCCDADGPEGLQTNDMSSSIDAVTGSNTASEWACL